MSAVNGSNRFWPQGKRNSKNKTQTLKANCLWFSNQEIFPESERDLVHRAKFDIDTKDENSAICPTLIWQLSTVAKRKCRWIIFAFKRYNKTSWDRKKAIIRRPFHEAITTRRRPETLKLFQKKRNILKLKWLVKH